MEEFVNNNTKRNKLDILLRILDITNVPVKKTHILYKANINFYQLTKYLNLLQDLRMLEEINDPYKGYVITEKGRTLTKLFGNLSEGGIPNDNKVSLREVQINQPTVQTL